MNKLTPKGKNFMIYRMNHQNITKMRDFKLYKGVIKNCIQF